MIELQTWLHSIHEGDKLAFEMLYENMHHPLFTIIYRITQDKALSEDILQDLFLKLYLSPPKVSTNSRAYLCQMARNLAIDSMRKNKPKVDLELAEKTIIQADDLSQAIDLEDAIQSLSERECQIFTMHIDAGLKFQEIAFILNTPLGTVFWVYQKAIMKLRNYLGDIR